jgi:hypothetical protein
MRKIIFLLITALALRLWNLDNVPHFADMDWFFDSARVARETGNIPLLGITSSITWLHQGALWTYFLLLPVPGQILTILAGTISVLLAYFAVGGAAALLLAVLPFAVLHSQIAYHTSFIPLFFFVSYLLIQRRRLFLAGLFIGFLYQLHLLTFIYWPLWLILLLRRRLSLWMVFIGFILGILPFIISGPVQIFGIFIWVLKQLLTGFGGVSSGISTAYLVVLLPGGVLLAGQMIQLIHAFRRRFDTQ